MCPLAVEVGVFTSAPVFLQENLASLAGGENVPQELNSPILIPWLLVWDSGPP